MAPRERVNLAVPKAVMARAKAKALQDNTSVSAVVRGLLAQWLDGALPTPREEAVQLELPYDLAAWTVEDFRDWAEKAKVEFRRLNDLRRAFERRIDRLEQQQRAALAELERRYEELET